MFFYEETLNCLQYVHLFPIISNYFSILKPFCNSLVIKMSYRKTKFGLIYILYCNTAIVNRYRKQVIHVN